MTKFPAWVIRHKKKGVEIRYLNDKYYAYTMTSKWDQKKQRSKKITGAYLGRITEDDLIPPKHKRPFQNPERITAKEYGATAFIEHITIDIRDNLKRHFPSDWQAIYCMAVLRFFHSTPLKNLETYFTTSTISDIYPNISLNPRNASKILFKIGSDRQSIVEFMKTLMIGTDHIIVDLTTIFSQATNITYCGYGHNSANEFYPQINLLLLFSKDLNKPVFFRLLPGSIPDISSIQRTIVESGATEALFVGDKGFHSEDNISALDNNQLRYILPLKRDSILIDYTAAKDKGTRNFDGYFFFQERHIWFKDYEKDGKRIILFLDEKLRTDEERSYLRRIGKKDATESIEEFHERQHLFGTIAVVIKTDKTASEVYDCLKSRLSIETAFDAFKNILEADKTYMRTDQHLQGWVFVNFISLYVYYAVYGLLLQHKQLGAYSPKDVILHCSKIQRITLNDQVIITESPKKTRTLIGKLGLYIPGLVNEKNKPIT